MARAPSPTTDPGDRRPLPRRPPTRAGVGAALVVGFGLLVVLWLAAVVDLSYRVREVTRQLDGLTERFVATDEALQAVRTAVLLAAIDWRDAFLDTDPARGASYRALLLEHQRECDSRISDLRMAGEPGLAGDVEALAREVRAYWAGVIPLVEMAPLRQAVETRRLLNDRVIPKRSQIISIVRHVQHLNRSRFQRQQREAAAIYAGAQTRLVVTGGLATVFSLVVGAVVFVHIIRLQQRLRGQLDANEAIATDLHRLSARIVSAQEDERRLIARELHDEVGQALTAVKLQVSMVGRSAAPEHRRTVDDARAVVDTALQAVRNLSRLLHPPMLDDIGLAAAVDWYLKGFAKRTNLAVTFEHAGMDRRAAPEVETCLYRVVQEATTNIARHATATRCSVYLQRLPESLVVTIEDNGRGFDPGADDIRASDGMGLLGMRERVAGFTGTFRLESRLGAGTRITVELPALEPAHTPAAGLEEGDRHGADSAG